MTSFPEGAGFIRRASSGDGALHHADRFAHRDFDPHLLQPGGTPEAATLNRAEQDLVVTEKKPARILLVDAALALRESHLLLLRSIPAIVENLASFADMYLHEERGYELVILALHPKSRESSEAAHFVRRRWSTARILLLAEEPAMIDDWLYDDRIDPHLNPATICEAAIRLMT
jgi:hypothetical protein